MEMFRFVEYRASMIFLMAFLLAFQPLRYDRRRTVLMAAAWYLLTGALEWMEFFTFSYDNVVVPITLIEIVLVQIFSLWISKYRDTRALFTGITSSVFVLPGNVMCLFTYLVSNSYVSSLLVQNLIHATLLIVFCVVVREDYLEEMHARSKGWGYLCPIPALFYAAVTTLTTWPQSIYRAPENILGIICVMLLMPMTYFIVIKMFANQRQEDLLNQNVQFLENYTERLKHEKEMLRESEYQTAVLRHDMRHVAALIATYLDADEKEKTYQVLRELNEKLETIRPKGYCDNVAINGVLSECAVLAEKNQVYLEMDISVAENLALNEFEYVTVLSNLLENAVYAAAAVDDERNRYIRVKMKKIKDQQLLEIENSYQGEIEFSRKTGLPLSDKGNGHGYGMGSVQAYAQKNGAVFDCTAQNGVFSVRFLVSLDENAARK